MKQTFQLLLFALFYITPCWLSAQTAQTHKMEFVHSVLYNLLETKDFTKRFENTYNFVPEKMIYPKSIPEKIDSLVKTNAIRPFNGICLISQDGTIRNSNIVYQTSNGYADTKKKTTFTPQTQFIVGSLSKQITAVLVLQAAQNHKLDLQTSVKKYLPSLKETWADSITVHQLLNHTSGVVGFGRPLAFAAGKGFSYSNTGYALLGQIVAAVNKKPYEKLVKELFKVCGMKHSAFPTPENITQLATPYLQIDGKIQAQKHAINAEYVAAAGLMTTAQDLVKWNTHLHTGYLLNKEMYQKMTTATTTRNHPIFGDVPYGYALQMAKGTPYEIGHGGYASGFVSISFYYPQYKTILIVLENLDWQSKDMKENFVFEAQIREILRTSLAPNFKK